MGKRRSDKEPGGLLGDVVDEVVGELVVAGAAGGGRWFMNLLRRRTAPPKPQRIELAPGDSSHDGHVKVRHNPPAP